MKNAVKQLLATLCFVFLSNAAAQDIYHATLDKEVKFMRDLQTDLALAKAQKKPLLILYSQVNCRFCHNVRSQFLKHIATDPQAPVIVREVMSGTEQVVNTASKEGADAFYKRMGIKFFPTVVLYDSQLKPIGDPLLGSDTSGFYGAYLDNAIEAAVVAFK